MNGTCLGGSIVVPAIPYALGEGNLISYIRSMALALEILGTIRVYPQHLQGENEGNTTTSSQESPSLKLILITSPRASLSLSAGRGPSL